MQPLWTRSRNCLALTLTALVGAVSLPATLKAEDHAGPETIVTLQSLLDEAERNNSQILAETAKANAAEARPAQEGALPDPMVGFMSTNMDSPVPFTEIGKDPQANAGLNVSQEIPFPGKRSIKEQMAHKEAESARHEVEATRLSVLSAVKMTYYESAFLQKAEEILSKNREALARLAQVARAQYEVGKASQQDVLKAQVEASIIEGKIFEIEQRKDSAAARLNALLNREPGGQIGLLEALEPPRVLPNLDRIFADAEQSPMLRAKKAMVERSSLQVDSKRLDYYPDFTVGAYYGYSGDLPDMWQLRTDVTVPLYFWKKQRSAVQESEQLLSQARREQTSTLQQLRAELKTAVAQVKASEKLIRLYHGRIIPDAGLTVESSVQGYQTGQLDFLTVLMNLVTQRDYSMAYIEEVMKLRTALARIEELTGANLD